jgi:TatD DNase family protein
MFTDTHAHLFDEQFANDLDGVFARATAAGVTTIIIPATDIATTRKAIAIAEKYPQAYATAGVHPHDTKDWNDDWLREIERLASHPKVVAIGEIGLDYHYDFSPREQQIRAFTAQLELACALDLPVVVHNRESDEDMNRIITSFRNRCLRAQFHCYNGSAADALAFTAMGHRISFTGNITFKKFDELREIARRIPPDHLMIETDSPYMAPVPFRGKRNEPAHVIRVAETLAELHGVSVEEMGRITTRNARHFFALGETAKLTFVYPLGKSLYINVTNRCNADCVFCARKGEAMLDGYPLRMKKSEEPPAQEYINRIGAPLQYEEIVFCGYGEPTIRWDLVKTVAGFVKENGGKTRINTNGHGNLINKRDITPEMHGLIDTVSISLNSTDRKQYAELMRVPEHYFDEMIDFAKRAKRHVPRVVLSIVDYPGIDQAAAEKFVTDEVGVTFRLRPYF